MKALIGVSSFYRVSFEKNSKKTRKNSIMAVAEAQSAMESVGDRTRILKKHLDRAEKFTKALDNSGEND